MPTITGVYEVASNAEGDQPRPNASTVSVTGEITANIRANFLAISLRS